MKYIAIPLVLLGLLGSLDAVAAFDCKAEKIESGDFLDSYLSQYPTECLGDSLREELTRYQLPLDLTRSPNGAELVRAYTAWGDIRDEFTALEENAVSTAGAPGAMKQVYGDLAARATEAMSQLRVLIKTEAAPDVSALGLDAWKITPSLDLKAVPVGGRPPLPDLAIGSALNADCEIAAGQICQQVLIQGRELMRYWALADHLAALYSKATLVTIRDQIVVNDESWNTYLYDSKPMLPLDFVLTDFIEKQWQGPGRYENGFRRPPKTQWFLLHPAVGVEYLSGALDGDQLQPMLYIEVVGANRWNEENRWIDVPVLRYLSGASVIASYTDRAAVKDTGYGLILTFSNVYTMGVARYGGETGVFLSLDLANMFRDKYKNKYEQFKDKLGDLKPKAEVP